MSEDEEMRKALEADGEKLRQLTGEDHGPSWADQLEEQWEKWVIEIAADKGLTVEEVKRRLNAGEAHLELDASGVGLVEMKDGPTG